MFSAHGLPESIIKDGDPYQWQCEQSAEAIVKELNIKVHVGGGEQSSTPQKSVNVSTTSDEKLVKKTVSEVLRILKEMEDNGEINIVGGVYSLKTGKVEML